MGQHMNGVKAAATTKFLDIVANGSNIRHTLGFGALCKLQGLLQALGVGIVAGHGCHNLNLFLFLGNPMGGIQSCLDQLWQIWEGIFHLGHNDVPWPAFCAHGVEWVLVPLASIRGLQVKVAIVGDGIKFLIGGGAAMEHSLAKLAQMATTQAEKPSWPLGGHKLPSDACTMASLAAICFFFFSMWLDSSMATLAWIWSSGQYFGSFLVAVMVGQHGTNSIEWMDQELGGLQGLLVHQTILLELLLDLQPLGANWHHGVILDHGDELLQILVHDSTKTNLSGYLTKGNTFSTYSGMAVKLRVF